ncbi:Putative SOS response-associated peptidase YedK [Pseudomonas sp. NFACC32-1]|uniref:SOS response-associated peptidase family protein n=1 Tax=Pseudomonas sp. NFACC32-1 TaxID=1566198 RepID=UPI00087717AE|nr:SOS response-associated peptidase family protein [Pseudomonas sp. NFACC32-1]SCX51755.1 Putative SOS response-associated peptidase YedK [Pseudomonas sp. NFACC32-1]
MCDGFVQHVCSKDSLAYFAQRDTPGERIDTHLTRMDLFRTTPVRPPERHSLIKPNMQVSAIRRRGGHLESIKVRWGWSPIWSVGTMPPLTHLPLHLVMRSKVFDAIKREGRVLVPVEGWYETQVPSSSQAQRLTYTTSRHSAPIFLAALAQASETPLGCDGLSLVTYGDIASQQQCVLALGTEDALDWLDPEFGWEQAQQLAERLNGMEPHLEPAMTAQVQGNL